MIALIDPRLWLAFLLAIMFAFGAGHWQGASSANKAAELRESKADEAAMTKLAEVTESVRQRERIMVRSMDAVAANYQEEISNAQSKIDHFRADVHSGALRLSIATRACRPNTAGADPAVTAGDRPETRAELMPADAAAFGTIAADGDRGILRANACVDAYQAVEAELAKQSQ